ncbi:MAG: hypothetical protein ACK493_01200 [Planctomycetota bacterium]|jgi:hypothetical protein|nr:hypothetical protein [Blastopirellula sp.]
MDWKIVGIRMVANMFNGIFHDWMSSDRSATGVACCSAQISRSRGPRALAARRLGVALALSALLFNTGCVGALAQLMYVIKGHKEKAEFAGLQEKTVAVVCITDSAAYGPDSLGSTINKAVSLQLKQNVRKCTVISPAKVSEWIDHNGWNQSNFIEIGRGVGADMVVAIDMGSYTIKEGQTLYKGRTDLTVTVYDISKGGQVAHVHGPTEYVFPKNGRPAIQTSERQFEAVYLAKLTDYISRMFYDADALDQVAEDATLM